MKTESFLYKLRYSLLKSDKARDIAYRLFYYIYGYVYVPIKVFFLRRKKQIKVVFLLSEVSVWKSENLYLSMLSHPRFKPFIVLEPTLENGEYEQELQEYLKGKKYQYIILEEEETIRNKVHPDIIFYQRPYGTILKKNDYYRNFYALFCYINYAFHSVDDTFFHNIPFSNLAWQNYYENELALADISKFMPNGGHNCIVTGLPMTDAYLIPSIVDPWKPQNTKKKRIIWAPHHTISDREWLNYSTFIYYAEFMVELAKKYQNTIQFAFKPHPYLRRKLNLMWGKERTDHYYNLWETMPNTQLETGKYVDLFKTSDALIHDCGSFTIEYHCTKKPALYLVRDKHHTDNMNEFGKRAFNLHYKANQAEDIKKFVDEVVINGNDNLKGDRLKFYNECLKSPNGKSTSENIINAILGI